MAVVVGVLAVVVLLAACGTTPDQDTFYTPPAPLPGAPGDVIRSRASVFTTDAIGKAPVPGISSWQVLYRSTTATGTPAAISGTVLVPTAAWTGTGRRPLITYGVGTRGIGDACAPSYTLANGFDYEAGLINDALNRGWAVAVSDMQGLGTPGLHTYEVGRAQGRALLDMARAAERLPGTGLSASNPVGIWGYSQGGTSAGWAAELAPTYAPDLQIKGVAAGGVPADLTAVANGLDGSAFFALALFAAAGYDAAYPELNLTSYLNPAGQTLFDTMQGTCLVSVDGLASIVGTAFHHFTDYTTTNPLNTPIWQGRLGENKLGSGKPTVPVFQYHAVIDEIVPFAQADQLHQTWCAKGVNLTWRTYLLAEHATGMIAGEQDALNFLADRFTGLPVSASC